MPRLIDEEPQVKTDAEGPDKIVKPFIFHGLDLSIEGEQAVGECPFCGKHRKFSVNLTSGLWRCWVCGAGTEKGGGNVYTFLQTLLAVSAADTPDSAYRELAADRGILDTETLRQWGACVSTLSGEWILPGYNPQGKLCQLYKWASLPSGKRSLLASPGLHHGLFGKVEGAVLNWNLKDTVYIAEGPWDGMALWEVMRQAKEVGEGEVQRLGATGSEAASLLKNASVLAVPGCNVFRDEWAGLFKEKSAVLMFDSDHPREVNGKTFRAGYDGMKRVVKRLGQGTEPAKALQYLRWGEDGYDPVLPDGTDLRDILCKGQNLLPGRLRLLGDLLNLIQPVPDDWLPGRGEAAVASGGTEIACVYCPDWPTLVNAWRLAMHWTEGLDRALSMMLASILSTRSAGDQLWFKILGPPSCGKSTLCEAVSINKRHVKAVSTIRGFHSGYRDPESRDNSSLILKLKDRTLVTKDGDTILQMPDRDRILSEARDLYDTTARSDYRNGMGMDHEGIRMSWLLCGTLALKVLDQSQLGARFLDCTMFHSLEESVEDSILERVINRSIRTVGIRTNCDMETQLDPAMLRAMQLTGGYINTICDNDSLLSGIEVPYDARSQIKSLGRFVAAMRARPSLAKDEERNEKELPSRLVSQLARAAVCSAGVLSKKETDSEVMRRVRQTALDTSSGKTVEYCKHLF